MLTIAIFTGILILSFGMALHSMRDERKVGHAGGSTGKHGAHHLDEATKKGRIVFMKDKTVHYEQ
jgi:hypothetical protein